MKISMLALGSTGDVLPYIALGRELQRRGHQVRLCTFPDFRQRVEQAGLTFFPVSGSGKDFISGLMEGGSGPAFLLGVKKLLREQLSILMVDLENACRGADGVISTYLGDLYQMAAESQHLPYIQTQFFPMEKTGDVPIAAFFPQHMGKIVNRLSYDVGYTLINGLEARFLKDWRREHQLSPLRVRPWRNYRMGENRVPVIYAIPEAVLPRPAEWPSHVYMTGFWHNVESYTPPPELENFLAEGEAPVYIGFGSMNDAEMKKVMEIVELSLEQTGLRAVVACGWSGQSLEKNSRVYPLEYVSHDWLFPRVRAVVHHGGAGTTAAAMTAGKPMLVVPFFGDQAFWGGRAWQLGLGPKPLNAKKLTATRLSKAMEDLVSQEKYQANAEKIAEKLRDTHPVEDAADLIEAQLAAWKRSG